MRTVYLLGWGRSGSTVLGAILGEVPGWCAVGELHHRFEPGITCGCGELADECPFWREVTELAEREIGSIDVERFRRDEAVALAPRRVPTLLHGRVTGDAAYVAEVMRALRRAAAAVTGAGVVVDGSKYPGTGALAALDEGSALVHLVRDPRATAFSWNRRRRFGQRAMGASAATGRWIEWNILAEVICRRLPESRCLRLRYEELVVNTVPAAQRIMAIGDPSTRPEVPPGLISSGVAHLGPNHLLDGNPSKFRTGQVALVLDNTWERQMTPLESWLIVSAAWPLMLRYGYPLTPPTPEDVPAGSKGLSASLRSTRW